MTRASLPSADLGNVYFPSLYRLLARKLLGTSRRCLAACNSSVDNASFAFKGGRAAHAQRGAYSWLLNGCPNSEHIP